MARKAHYRITRTHTRWAAEVATDSVVEVSVWEQAERKTAEISFYGQETSWYSHRTEISDETAVALSISLIRGKDVAGILADRMDEIGHSDHATYLRRGNEVEVAEAKKRATAEKAKRNRRLAKHAMESLGMKKVRGVMGGTYWE